MFQINLLISHRCLDTCKFFEIIKDILKLKKFSTLVKIFSRMPKFTQISLIFEFYGTFLKNENNQSKLR